LRILEGEETDLSTARKGAELQECVQQKGELMKELCQVPWMRRRKRGLGKLP
jgi:flagellar biosynthesis/type III secretory pathway chaperone